jgi:hypothetical protein
MLNFIYRCCADQETANFKNKQVKCLLLFTLYLFMACSCMPQARIGLKADKLMPMLKGNERILSEIPQPLRESFAKRLTLLIEYERAHKWNDQYKLLYSQARREETADDYYRRRKEQYSIRIKGFIPDSIIESSNHPITVNYWSIPGCIIGSYKGKNLKYYGEVSAFYEKDNWYFEGPPSGIVQIDGGLEKCQNDEER